MATSSVLPEILEMFSVSRLKTEQQMILDCLLDQKNCVAVLPTGYGKSLPFQMLIPTVRALDLDKFANSKVIVCCPLVSLMQDQVDKLSKIENLTAAYKGSSLDNDKRILEGLVDIIYASPETLVGDPMWRRDLQKLDVMAIVIDEFHTIATWGEDSDGSQQKAFRKWFGNLGELRSLFPNAVILALSATCTKEIMKRVMNILQLDKSTVKISVSPNKTNIKLNFYKIPNQIEMAMSWLVDALYSLKEKFPRTIIYCTSILDTSKLFSYIVTELPECAKYIDMFHSETTTIKKNEIITSLKTPDSSLRLVISTNALGMGIDIKDCQSVVLFGPPANLVDLLQEIGRAGRDDQQSAAMIIYNSNHLRKMGTDIKQIVRGKECRRLALMDKFLTKNELESLKNDESNKHSCCDICTEICKCGHCVELAIEQIFNSDTKLIVDDSDSETEDYNLSDYEYGMNVLDIDFSDEDFD